MTAPRTIVADFCKQCTAAFIAAPGEVLPNDMAGLSTEADTNAGLYAQVLCEGCGLCLVDHTGKCVSTECFEKHGAKEEGRSVGNTLRDILSNAVTKELTEQRDAQCLKSTNHTSEET